MRELALHLLDIIENSVAAEATAVSITIDENTAQDHLLMIIEDNGKGMDQDMVARVMDPFVTTKEKRKIGLGVPLLKAAAEACNGYLAIESQPGIGTKVIVRFQHSHIDRMPLGDLVSTILNVIIAYPHIHWILNYIVNDKKFTFDDAPIKQELDGIPITEPGVISFIREYLETGLLEPHHSQTSDDVTSLNNH